MAYDRLNSGASDPNVDFVMLGCPHDSIEQVWEAARLLDGKRISANVNLWIDTPRAIKEVADRSGYTAMIESAGARLLSDTCPAISRILPKGVKVVATDWPSRRIICPRSRWARKRGSAPWRTASTPP